MVFEALSALAVTVLAILALRPFALTVDLVDHKADRDLANPGVPLIGGLAMFLGLVVGVGLLEHPHQHVNPLLAVCGLMLVTGLLEDRYTVSKPIRVLVRLVGGVVLVGTTHILVRNLGDPLGTGAIMLAGAAATVFTIGGIACSVTAFQVLDGMDGLAGLNALAALVGLSVLSWGTAQGTTEALLCLLLGSAVAGFMLFNFPFGLNRRLRCFMGDAGSTFIGVAIGWLCVAISQKPIHDGLAHPSYVLWMVALPLFELWSTFLRRVLAGRSPFAADAGHFHHRLQLAGFSVRSAFVLFFLLNLVLVGFGLLLAHLGVADWVAFSGLVCAGLGVVYSMDYAHHLLRWLPALRRGSAPVRVSESDAA